MGKKIAAALLAAYLCLACSGCSSFSGLDPKNLMSPPKANADQQAIYKLLQGSRQDVIFVYPKNGSYRSAIIMHDFTGDGEEDAIGFCSLEETGGVEVQFLKKTDGQWDSAAAFQNTAIQVDRVLFGDLNGDGTEDVLIGWGSTGGASGRAASVSAYAFDSVSGEVDEFPLGPYGELILTDFDRDSVYEVFTVDKFVPPEEEGDEPAPARAKVYAWRDGSVSELYSADADNSISGFSSLLFGKISADMWGVLLDGTKADGSMSTQVFFPEDGVLRNLPQGVNTEDYVNSFSRPSAVSLQCRDINGDGTVNVPQVSLLPGLPEGAVHDSTSYLVSWQTFLWNYRTRTVIRSLMNSAENYWFRIPPGLEKRITASNDAERRIVTYTEVILPEEPDGIPLLGSPLFLIRAFTPSAWETWGTSGGYEQLAAQNETIYGIQVLTRSEEMLSYIDQIRQSFKLISE